MDLRKGQYQSGRKISQCSGQNEPDYRWFEGVAEVKYRLSLTIKGRLRVVAGLLARCRQSREVANVAVPFPASHAIP